MTRIIVFLLLTWPLFLNAKTTAYSVPTNDLKIDGNLNDWPENAKTFEISKGDPNQKIDPESLSAQFSAVHNLKENAIYLAVEITDDEHADSDELIFYFDLKHSIDGGYPIYIAMNDREMAVVENRNWPDGYNQLKQDQIEYKFNRKENKSIYEIKVSFDQPLKLNQVIGLDFYILDGDPKQNVDQYVLWTNGASKSMFSEKLGNLVLCGSEKRMGKINTKLDIKNGESQIDQINIVSLTNEDFWVSTPVDANGNISAMLPAGKYKFAPCKLFSSPIYSGDFNQNTKKYNYSELEFEVKAEKMTQLEPISVEVIERPEEDFDNAWLLENKSNKKDLKKHINQWAEYLDIPGYSIAVIKDNKVVFEENDGYLNLETMATVDRNSIFESASITKSVFAIMVLRQAEKGIIDLDKPLHEYLPFPNLEGDERAKKMTARMVLNHQSGLANWAWGGPGGWESGQPTELLFEPGTSFGYSGEAMNYLGRVLEKASGKTLKRIFNEEVATPLGLENTYFAYEDDLNATASVGYFHQYRCYKGREEYVSPASSLQSNAYDLKKYVLALMRQEYYSEEIYKAISTPATLVPSSDRLYDPNIKQSVSHGFFVQETKHGKLIAHGGNNGDYDCKFVYNPDSKSGYVIFTNSNLGDEFIRAIDQFLFGKL